MTEEPVSASDRMLGTEIRHLVGATHYLSGLLLVLIAAIVSFHPWFIVMVEKALAVLPLLLLVLIFVYVVNPMVEFVLRRVRKIPQMERFSYQKSLVVTYLFLLLVVGIGLAILVPKLAREMQTLAVNLPSFAQKIQGAMTQYRDRYFEALPAPVKDQITQGVGEIGSTASKLIQAGLGYLGAFSQTLIWVLGAMIFVPLIGFYILKDGDAMLEFLVHFVAEDHQPRTRRILLDIHEAMQNFLKGQVILCLIIGTVTTAAMAFVLPQYCIALGLLAGITEAVPVVGPFLGAVPAVIIAFAVPGKGGLGLALLVVVIYMVIQQLENVILVPRVMGESLGLHPLSLIMGMMVFGNIFGFWGVVLASPLVATVKILVTHLFLRRRAAREAPPPGEEPPAEPAPASEALPERSEEPAEAPAAEPPKDPAPPPAAPG